MYYFGSSLPLSIVHCKPPLQNTFKLQLNVVFEHNFSVCTQLRKSINDSAPPNKCSRTSSHIQQPLHLLTELAIMYGNHASPLYSHYAHHTNPYCYKICMHAHERFKTNSETKMHKIPSISTPCTNGSFWHFTLFGFPQITNKILQFGTQISFLTKKSTFEPVI